jgi:L-fuculose-phosphate aldolase
LREGSKMRVRSDGRLARPAVRWPGGDAQLSTGFTYFDLLVVVSFPSRAVTWPRKDFPMARIARISDRQHRVAIVQFGRMLHENGFVAATDGNLSVRLDEERLLVTPTCISKGRMRTSDMVIVGMDGRRLAGKRRVSSEIGMHLLIYRLRPDVRGIVHAHPPTATGFAASGYDLNRPLVCEVVVGLGSIPLARYGTPGTPELTDALEPLIPHHDAILMANHGVVTFGSSLESAYMKMETVEHFAKIALVAHLLGNEQPLGEKEVEKLHEVRHRYNGGGAPTPPSRLVVADDPRVNDLQSDDEPKETAGSRR